MFKFLRDAFGDQPKPKSESLAGRKLYFKGTREFIDYWCQYGNTNIVSRKSFVAIVEGVERSSEGETAYFLSVASPDGGFKTTSMLWKPGPELAKGDLVLWMVREFNEVSAKIHVKHGFDRRGGWIGPIIAKIAPEFDANDGRYTILHTYQ